MIHIYFASVYIRIGQRPDHMLNECWQTIIILLLFVCLLSESALSAPLPIAIAIAAAAAAAALVRNVYLSVWQLVCMTFADTHTRVHT